MLFYLSRTLLNYLFKKRLYIIHIFIFEDFLKMNFSLSRHRDIPFHRKDFYLACYLSRGFAIQSSRSIFLRLGSTKPAPQLISFFLQANV